MSAYTPLQLFSPKHPDEEVVLCFNFARLTSAPTAPVWTVAWLRGTPDPTPEAMKSGAASVANTRTYQAFVGGVAGADYLLSCQVGAGAQRFVAQAMLQVRA